MTFIGCIMLVRIILIFIEPSNIRFEFDVKLRINKRK